MRLTGGGGGICFIAGLLVAAASSTCPPYEDVGADNSTCVCLPGYARGVGDENCTACARGYYKATLGDAGGVCSRCAEVHGLHSSSDAGAAAVSDCYCMEATHMDSNKCVRCSEDWVCPGGFVLAANGSRVHAPGEPHTISAAHAETSVVIIPAISLIRCLLD
eukprot:TRINITY_DN32390_c0_g1_i2.p1 TRINITY_DN32390_c0_g1~~TRINITY_DN32390_c0_g1_i2.p1  ORF type:complete len:163 (-),score=3.69 TRINITY_DN32390_c0_g1_i2:332-820(-)